MYQIRAWGNGIAQPSPYGRLSGLTLPAGEYRVNEKGDRRYFTPYYNYTANNGSTGVFSKLEELIGPVMATQIHELGNSIEKLTGKYVGNKDNQGDPDSGQELEGCMNVKLVE